MNTKHSLITRNDGVILVAVVFMLLIMSVMAASMYALLSKSIGISGGFYRKTSTKSVASQQAAMVIQTVVQGVINGSINPASGLVLSDPNVLLDITGGLGSDIATDTPENNPDFTYTTPNGVFTATADVDYLQTVPVAGGSIEFASAYDGVGNGQTMGSAYLVENLVHIRSQDNRTGEATAVRFVISQ